MGQDEKALAALDPEEAELLRRDLAWSEHVISEYEEGINPFFYRAPVLVIIHADLSITDFPLENSTVATYQMMLMAQSLGLGTCWVSSFYLNANKSLAIREILAIPPDNKILMAFVLGYPAIPFRRLVDRNEPKVKWIG